MPSFLTLVLSILFTATSLGANNNWLTYPNSLQTPKKSTKRRVINLGTEIPQNPEDKTWVLSRRMVGTDLENKIGVPVYSGDKQTGLSFVGFVPPGTEIKIVNVDAFSRTHYYSMPKPDSFIRKAGHRTKPTPKLSKSKRKNSLETIWVSGNYIIQQP